MISIFASIICMNKFYLPIVIVVFIIASVLIIYYGFAPDKGGWGGELNPRNNQDASLLIDFGDNKQRMFVGDVIGDMTILDALEFSSESSDLKYDFDPKVKNLAAIDGFSNDGSIWNVYMNGSLMKKSPDEIKIKAGDAVELKFEQNSR